MLRLPGTNFLALKALFPALVSRECFFFHNFHCTNNSGKKLFSKLQRNSAKMARTSSVDIFSIKYTHNLRLKHFLDFAVDIILLIVPVVGSRELSNSLIAVARVDICNLNN